jgi:hypothetical protein
MLKASQTELGKYYRNTRDNGIGGNHYYIRPKLTAEKWFKRMSKRTMSHKGSEGSHWAAYKKDNSLILMQSRLRGTDPFTGNRYELQHYVMLKPDKKLREVKTPPGYQRN